MRRLALYLITLLILYAINLSALSLSERLIDMSITAHVDANKKSQIFQKIVGIAEKHGIGCTGILKKEKESNPSSAQLFECISQSKRGRVVASDIYPAHLITIDGYFDEEKPNRIEKFMREIHTELKLTAGIRVDAIRLGQY
jgi:hypothetical protein